jgi:hypothetical protein
VVFQGVVGYVRGVVGVEGGDRSSRWIDVVLPVKHTSHKHASMHTVRTRLLEGADLAEGLDDEVGLRAGREMPAVFGFVCLGWGVGGNLRYD